MAAGTIKPVWLVKLIGVLITIGAIGLAFYQFNTMIRHTYVAVPSTPGTLVSDRYKDKWVFVFLLGCHAFYGATVLTGARSFIRKTRYGQPVCVAVLVFFGLACFTTTVFFTAEWAGANGPEAARNLCSDRLYCCVAEYNVKRSNQEVCGSILPCNPPIGGRPDVLTTFDKTHLRKHEDCLYIMIYLWALTGLELIVFFIYAYPTITGAHMEQFTTRAREAVAQIGSRIKWALPTSLLVGLKQQPTRHKKAK